MEIRIENDLEKIALEGLNDFATLYFMGEAPEDPLKDEGFLKYVKGMLSEFEEDLDEDDDYSKILKTSLDLVNVKLSNKQ